MEFEEAMWIEGEEGFVRLHGFLEEAASAISALLMEREVCLMADSSMEIT